MVDLIDFFRWRGIGTFPWQRDGTGLLPSAAVGRRLRARRCKVSGAPSIVRCLAITESDASSVGHGRERAPRTF